MTLIKVYDVVEGTIISKYTTTVIPKKGENISLDVAPFDEIWGKVKTVTHVVKSNELDYIEVEVELS